MGQLEKNRKVKTCNIFGLISHKSLVKNLVKKVRKIDIDKVLFV